MSFYPLRVPSSRLVAFLFAIALEGAIFADDQGGPQLIPGNPDSATQPARVIPKRVVNPPAAPAGTNVDVEIPAARVEEKREPVRVLSPVGGTTSVPSQSPTPNLPSGTAANRQPNFCANISEPFLNRIVARERIEDGLVRDFVLGADVYGRQTTDTKVQVDFRPDPNGACFDVVLDGITTSNTRGFTNQAVVDVVGIHQFQAKKAVFFDGAQFRTRMPTIVVNPQNHTVGAETRLSGIPIVGRIASNYARNVSESRRPESEAIAGLRVQQRVLPVFNRSIDNELAAANEKLEANVRSKLRSVDLLPKSERAWTDDRHLFYTALVGEGSVGTRFAYYGGPIPCENGVSISIHESLLNHLVDALGLAGTSVTDNQMRAFAKSMTAQLLPGVGAAGNAAGEAQADEPHRHTVMFDEKDPVRFRFDDDVITVVIRAAFEPARDEVIPLQQISIPFGIALDGDKLILDAGKISIEAVHPPASAAVQLIHEGAILKRIEASLPQRQLNRRFTIPLPQGGDLSLRVDRTRAADGWLTVTFD